MTYSQTLTRFFTIAALLFVGFIVLTAVLESIGVSRQLVGYLYILVPFVGYAIIGMLSRTSDIHEYFVASRSVPGVFNGMATAADWMSAASFLGVAGTLFYSGFEALALLVGWTGGFVLVALLVAPYLRKFEVYSVGDFLAIRYPGTDRGRAVRLMCVVITILVSFIYVVAQIYAVGLISSRFAGVEFGIGVFFGLAGILLCSFLGGMRAVTWTAVAQYLVMIIAMIVCVIVLIHPSQLLREVDKNKAGQVGIAELTLYISTTEKKLLESSAENEVRVIYQKQVQRYQLLIDSLPVSWSEGLEARRKNLELARTNGSSFQEIKKAERDLAEFPQSAAEARKSWTAQRKYFAEKVTASVPQFKTPQDSGGNLQFDAMARFIAVAFTLMCGTVALPHLLLRFFTTPDAKSTRQSVLVALGCIVMLYLASPWLSIAVKMVVYQNLVGSAFSDLPNWMSAWQRVMPGLATITDVNEDGIVQFAEIGISPDILVLITPELAGLPFFVSGLIAAGGLAAALSTADGLLLAISNALSHDVYYRIVQPNATFQRRVTISKIALLGVSLFAAWITSLQPGNIVSLVGVAFVLAGSTLFVPLVAGVFWSGANSRGAKWAMVSGFLSAVMYLSLNNSNLMGLFGLQAWSYGGAGALAAGIVTMPISALFMIFGSLTLRISEDVDGVMYTLRSPE